MGPKKAISPIISIILLLLITIAIAGAGYSYLSTYWESTTGQNLALVSTYHIGNEANLIIRNTGTRNITLSEVNILDSSGQEVSGDWATPGGQPITQLEPGKLAKFNTTCYGFCSYMISVAGGISVPVTVDTGPGGPPATVCGDGAINGTEVCECGIDGICGNSDDDTGTDTCITLGYVSGDLTCSPDCLSFDTSSCVGALPCGNGICEPGENCPQDNVSCPDNPCYEPTCVSGCGQTLVALNGNDESCLSPDFCDGFGNCVEEGVGITNCTNIISSGTYYLQNDVNSSGTCFTIGANNVTLDCNGYTINYSQSATGYGVTSNSYNNITIKSCNIVHGGSSTVNNHGIWIRTVNDSLIDNVIITTGGTDNNYGVYLYVSNFNIINNTRISTTGSAHNNFGIYMYTSSFNNITNTNITTNGTSTNHGLWMREYSNSNIFNNIRISTNGSVNSNHGLYIQDSLSNSVVNSNVSTDGAGTNNIGIYLRDSNDSSISSNFVEADASGSENPGFYFSGVCFNNTILNNTITTNGTGKDYGFNFYGPSTFNIITNNTISTSGSTTSHAFYFEESSGYPENNNLTNNILLSIAGDDLNFKDAGINYTYLIDQPISDYTFTGAGGIIYVKDTTYGEIRFLEAINGTGTSLSNDIQINSNSIFVNNTNNIGLNKSADISIYGLGFADAIPQVDLEDDGTFINCTASTDPACSKLSYSGGTLVFNTTHFTTFRAAEAPT